MSSLMCCNPIHVDDEEIDMELEQVWDLQRKRSNGGRGPSTARKGRINLLNRGIVVDLAYPEINKKDQCLRILKIEP